MSKSYDVIIVGAGVVGLSTAVHLQRKGKSVLILDKKGIAQETSYGNSGIIESSYVLPFAPPHWSNIPKIMIGAFAAARMSYPTGLKSIPWVLQFYRNSMPELRKKNGKLMRPLVENAVEDHKDLLKNTAALEYIVDTGRVKLHRSEQSFQKAAYERQIATEYSVPFEIFSTNEFNEIEPAINPVYHKAVSWTGSKRYTNPAKALKILAGYFQKDGGAFNTETVNTLTMTDKNLWQVQSDQGSYTAKHVVICAGAWSNQLLKPLGYQFPIGMKRGYHQHFKSDKQIEHAIVDADIGYLVSPMEQGMRITTGAEFAAHNAPHNPKQVEQVLPHARDLVDLDSPSEEKAWLGTRPCLADSLPIIGASRNHEGLWFNFGHGHCGITAGPASGRLLSEMIAGVKTFCDPAPYSPYRF